MTAEDSAAARRPRRQLFFLLAFIAVAAVLALAVWRAWDSRPAPGDGEAPLLRAEPGPARERPEDPGGMEVPYRDMLALHELGVPRDDDGDIVVERLLPPPERPLPRPGTDAPEAGDGAEGAPAAPPDPPPAAEEEDAAATAANPQETEAAPADEPAPPSDDPEAPRVEPADAADREEPRPEAEAAEPDDPIAALLAREGGFLLQLGAFRTEAEVETGWRRALGRAPELLAPLKRFVARSDGFHRLRVGPFPDRGGAARLCEALRRVEVACFIVAS